jgi:hypothetical protein
MLVAVMLALGATAMQLPTHDPNDRHGATTESTVRRERPATVTTEPTLLVSATRATDAANAKVWLEAVAAFKLRQLAQQRAEQRLAMWDELAHCESGGQWHVRDRFGGGLGIYVGTWRMFDGDEFAANPGDATKEQQIVVAERIYRRFGLDGWGCAHALGWVD